MIDISNQKRKLKNRTDTSLKTIGLGKKQTTGLLNYQLVASYVDQYFKHVHSNSVYVLFVVGIDNIDLVKYTMGTQVETEIIMTVTNQLSNMFRAIDVIGQTDTNEFLVFITNPLLGEKTVLNKGESITRIKLLENVAKLNLTIRVGIYMTTNKTLSFEELYQKTHANLQIAKQQKQPVYLTSDISKEDINQQKKYMSPQFSPVPINFLLDHIDEDIRILEVSNNIKQLYISPKFSQKLNDGNKLEIQIHPHDSSRYDNMLKQAIETMEPVEDELRVLDNGIDWKWRWLRMIKIPYHDSEYPIILEISRDITESKKQEQYLSESGKMLKIAFENTTREMWEVDVENKVYTFFNYKNGFDSQSDTLADFPESLISTGWVHPDSAVQFRRFGAELLNGKTQDSGSFILRYRSSDSYGWANLSYRMIFDSSGAPVKAIGVKNYLSDSSQRKQEIISSPALPDAVYPTLVFCIKVNLTEDSIKELWVEGAEKTDFAKMQKYTDILEAEKERLFLGDDSKSFMDNLSLESLFQAAKHEVVWKSLKYRRVYISGVIHWVLNTVNLIKDPISQDVYLFDYLNDIEQKKRWEYGVDIVLDPLTGFYQRTTVLAIIKNLLESDSVCAIALVRINGFLQMTEDVYGTPAEKQSYIAAVLNLAFGANSLIGRYDDETLILFFKDILSPSSVKKRLEDAFSFVRSSMSGTKIMRLLRFIAGVDCMTGPVSDYESIILQLEEICRLWKNSASDIVVFLDKDNHEQFLNSINRVDDELVISEDNLLEEELTSKEKDVALNCLAFMAMSNSTHNSIKNILKNIGQYYEADRVYILALAENNHVVTMMYEWTNENKYSIQRAVSGVRIEKFPFLCRCLQDKKPAFIKNKKELSGLYLNNGNSDDWCYTVIPIVTQKNFYLGFFCIENPKIHQERIALPTMMIKYIFNISHNRPNINKSEISSWDSLTNLPNLRSYTDIIDSINSDMYNSLGAVALDVPDLSVINSIQGFEYGSKLILHVAEVLSETFGRSYLFRTWDSEFVVLSPNTTLEVFIDKCTWVRDILQRCYYKQIRIGYTWSSGVFFAKKLVKEAKAIMRCEKIKSIPATENLSLWGMRHDNFANGVKKGKFIVHFQPKIDMTTETIIGAEALVRGIDDNGEIIPPGKFIDVMEENGSIRDLDFFVLDQTFAYLEKWYLKGYDPLNVSINISRVTLLDSAAPASILAIQSRYPDILSGLIELEITESACDIEKATLGHILDNFRQFGMKFGLDDFGSHYSNMSIFTNVKFDTIKLDRSLINELASNEADQLLVKNIIQICKNGQMTCVAEGVETKAQVSALLAMGCSICQGYYYSKPLSPTDFEQKWLDNTGGD